MNIAHVIFASNKTSNNTNVFMCHTLRKKI